jgi:hypothetical protein
MAVVVFMLCVAFFVDAGSTSNEAEISHGRVSWQTRWTYFAMGPLASSIG